ncbi:hypothetical protein OQA88_13112 [Cercophora sp. LCS_1]
MLVKSLSALATLALALGVAAEPKPYKPQLMKTSVRDLFGVVRRDTPGYQPTQAVCGTGNTCAEACGSGYETCASKDDEIHCYNLAAAETCCPNKSGNSCDAGFYCTVDKEDETWCCPNGMDTTACAAAYSVSGGLVSQTAKPESSSTSSAAPSFTPVKNTTVATFTPTAGPTGGFRPTGGFGGVNSTGVNPTFGAPTATPTKIQEGAGSMAAPASALALIIAGVAALL